MRKRTLLLLSLAPLLFSTTQAEDKEKTLTPPQVRILSGERTTLADAPFFSFSCEATNPGKTPLMFVGYRPDSFELRIPEGSISPIYIIQFEREGKWKEHAIGWCGTGMGGIELPAGKPQKFGFAVPADLAGKEVRVGLRWSKPQGFDTAEPEAFTTTWSEPFVLADIDKPKAK